MFFKKKKNTFMIPVSGKMIPLSMVNDETFRSGMMGSGFAIEPSSQNIVSPVDGTIKMVFPTGHAIGITFQDGKELLIHAGIDTVELQGQGFQVMVRENQKIKAGDPLLQIDLPFIKEKGYDSVIIIVFPNENDLRLPQLPKQVTCKDSITIF